MKSIMTLLAAAFLFAALPANAQFGDLVGKVKKEASKVTGGVGLSQEEAGNGIKEALNVGVDKAVQSLSANGGYLKSIYKIELPEEVQAITSRVSKLPGFGDVEEKLVLKMNEAAELAAGKAKPIFVGAIKQLTFKDAIDLLMGDQDAATRYLERTTATPLTGEFQPVIANALDEVNARSYWKSVVTAYNKIPFVQKTNPELDQYVTEKALGGMFGLVEVKEREIREQPAMRTTETLKKVFSQQDK